MSIRLVTTPDFAVVGLVTGVNMTVFFSVTRIGKSSVTSLEFTTEWFFTCNKNVWRIKTLHLSEQTLIKLHAELIKDSVRESSSVNNLVCAK